MAKVKGINTKPELIVRKITYALGYKYRLHCADLPGKPDLAFKGRKRAIFVHGCFWHQHPGCKKTSIPETRAEWWKEKLKKNVVRDKRSLRALRAMGYKCEIIWECETRNPDLVTTKVNKLFSGRK